MNLPTRDLSRAEIRLSLSLRKARQWDRGPLPRMLQTCVVKMDIDPKPCPPPTNHFSHPPPLLFSVSLVSTVSLCVSVHF